MANNKYDPPTTPPPPLFLNKKERDFQKQIADEVLEYVMPQSLVYYAVDVDLTDFHPLYGEALEKSFLPPVVVKGVFVEYDDQITETISFGIDRRSQLTVFFHKRRITEDQNLQVREGDYVYFGGQYYEIVQLKEPRELWGQIDYKIEVEAICIKCRQDMFDAT